MRKRIGVLAVMTVLVPCVIGSTNAEQLFMSAAAAVPELKKCDTLHHEQTCNRYHVVGTNSTSVAACSELTLNDKEYRVRWAGVAYRLDNGTVVSRNGGQWQQVFPNIAPVKATGWSDNDGDKAPSVSDSVTINGASSKIKDVRLYLWVEPIE